MQFTERSLITHPDSNPANQYDVNADGVVDQLDLDLVTTETQFPATSSSVPEFYLDANHDTFFTAADISSVQSAINGTVSGGPDYVDAGSSPVTLYTYDPAGNLTSVTDANGNATRHHYDVRSRKIKTVQRFINTFLAFGRLGLF